jgi:hypothetical protein
MVLKKIHEKHSGIYRKSIANQTGIFIVALNVMKENTFYVLVNLRTCDGFENFGRFNLGNNRKAAARVFGQFKGSPDVNEKTVLTVELMETVDELPLNLNILACTLEELSYNTRVIAKETFKLHNLKQNKG